MKVNLPSTILKQFIDCSKLEILINEICNRIDWYHEMRLDAIHGKDYDSIKDLDHKLQKLNRTLNQLCKIDDSLTDKEGRTL